MQRFCNSEEDRILHGRQRPPWHWNSKGRQSRADFRFGATENGLQLWVKALLDGDTWALRYLLRENPSYLLIFPGSKVWTLDWVQAIDRQVKGERYWCSALNVAAFQGCEDLVLDISETFDFLQEVPVSSEARSAQSLRELRNAPEAEEEGSNSDVGHGRAVAVPKILPDEELELLLLADDPNSGLNALEQATWNGNVRIIEALLHISTKLSCNPYRRFKDDNWERGQPTVADDNYTRRSEASKIISEALGDALMEEKMDEYFSDLEYRFQTWPAYLFHFCCKKLYYRLSVKVLQYARSKGSAVYESLMRLLDAQGRTAFHVLLLNNWTLFSEVKLFPDGAGRSVLHYAVMVSDVSLVRSLLIHSSSVGLDVNAYWDFCALSGVLVDVRKLMEPFYERRRVRNQKRIGWSLVAAVHLAMFRSNLNVIHAFLDHTGTNWTQPCPCWLSVLGDHVDLFTLDILNVETVFLTPLQLAATWDETTILSLIMVSNRGYDIANPHRPPDLQASVLDHIFGVERQRKFCPPLDVSALHLAALLGNIKALTLMLNSGSFDPLVEDHEGNNALHYAAYGFGMQITVHPLWLGIPCPSYIQQGRNSFSQMCSDDQRQGCIELLLQAGLVFEKQNKKGRVAEPGPLGPTAMLSWWREKLLQEAQDMQQMPRFCALERLRCLRGLPRPQWKWGGVERTSHTFSDFLPWLKALRDGDTWALRFLLRKNPSYLFIFPGSRIFNFHGAMARFEETLRGSQWQGCSALNVAACQGDEDLFLDIVDVLDFYNGIASISRGEQNLDNSVERMKRKKKKKRKKEEAFEDKCVDGGRPGAPQAFVTTGINFEAVSEETVNSLLLGEEPKSGLSPLDQAIWNGNVRMIQLLQNLLISRKLLDDTFGSYTEERSESKLIVGERSSSLQSKVLRIISQALGETLLESDLQEKYFSNVEYRFQAWLRLPFLLCKRRP